MEKDTGGAAFPSRGGMMFYVPQEAEADIKQAISSLDQEHSGITTRDYFAAHAPITVEDAMLACGYGEASIGMFEPGTRYAILTKLAEMRGEYASAMLAERLL